MRFASASARLAATSSSSSTRGSRGVSKPRPRLWGQSRREDANADASAGDLGSSSAELPPHLEEQVLALQGKWGDDIGLVIQIEGRQALFSDGTGPWKFEEAAGALVLRGARLAGSVEAPAWRFPTGVERQWARTEVAWSGDSAWSESFLRYKEERLELRRRLQRAFADQDFDNVAKLRSEWESEGSTYKSISEEQRALLVAGRWLVPGSCFRHKKFGYQGVVLGCDPWCTYPAWWRAKWLANRPRGEAQPFYHCLVDENDRAGQQTRYVAQENMEHDILIFPIKAKLADLLFERCDQLGCYIPGTKLEEALQRQTVGGGFVL